MTIRTISNPIVAAAAMLAACLPLAVAAAADAPPAGAPEPHGWGPEHIFSRLDLTPAQQQSVHSLMAAARPVLQDLHEQIHANSLKLRQTTPDDAGYAAVVAEVSQSNGALTSQLTAKEADLRAQLYALLTPAQKAQLAALEAKMAAHGPREHGPGPGSPPPPDDGPGDL